MVKLALAVAVGIVALSFIGNEHPTVTLMKALIVFIPVAGIGYGSYLVKHSRIASPTQGKTATQKIYKNGIKRAYLVQDGLRFEAYTGNDERREKKTFRSQQAAERWIKSKLQ
jgi:hypothetical protein